MNPALIVLNCLRYCRFEKLDYVQISLGFDVGGYRRIQINFKGIRGNNGFLSHEKSLKSNETTSYFKNLSITANLRIIEKALCQNVSYAIKFKKSNIQITKLSPTEFDLIISVDLESYNFFEMKGMVLAQLEKVLTHFYLLHTFTKVILEEFEIHSKRTSNKKVLIEFTPTDMSLLNILEKYLRPRNCDATTVFFQSDNLFISDYKVRLILPTFDAIKYFTNSSHHYLSVDNDMISMNLSLGKRFLQLFKSVYETTGQRGSNFWFAEIKYCRDKQSKPERLYQSNEFFDRFENTLVSTLNERILLETVQKEPNQSRRKVRVGKRIEISNSNNTKHFEKTRSQFQLTPKSAFSQHIQKFRYNNDAMSATTQTGKLNHSNFNCPKKKDITKMTNESKVNAMYSRNRGINQQLSKDDEWTFNFCQKEIFDNDSSQMTGSSSPYNNPEEDLEMMNDTSLSNPFLMLKLKKCKSFCEDSTFQLLLNDNAHEQPTKNDDGIKSTTLTNDCNFLSNESTLVELSS